MPVHSPSNGGTSSISFNSLFHLKFCVFNALCGGESDSVPNILLLVCVLVGLRAREDFQSIIQRS